MLLLLITTTLKAQTGLAPVNYKLTYFPVETRSMSLGASGTSLNGDMSAINNNPARMGLFIEKNSYSFDTYKLPSISPSAYYTSLKYILSKGNNSFGTSINYFTPGNYEYVSEGGGSLNTPRPAEYKVTLSDAIQIAKNSYIGASFNLLGRSKLPMSNQNSINSIAADLGYLQRFTFKKGNDDQILAGITLQNIGSKTNDGKFIPTNLSISSTYLKGYTDDNIVATPYLLGVQLDRMMVPSLPIYNIDGTILKGNDPNTLSGLGSIFSSLFDDPYNMNLTKWRVQTYGELILNNMIALRGGYSYENPIVGNRKYITLGTGIKWINNDSKYNLDMAIILPTNTVQSVYSKIISISLNIKYGNRW
jgi:hypothetical protein